MQCFASAHGGKSLHNSVDMHDDHRTGMPTELSNGFPTLRVTPFLKAEFNSFVSVKVRTLNLNSADTRILRPNGGPVGATAHSSVAADAENIEIPALDFARATPFLAKPYVRFAF